MERIYGIKNGGDRLHNVHSATQSDLANKLGVDERSYANYKKLTTLIPELQTMVDEKQITTSVASRILARLSPVDQKNLILTYPVLGYWFQREGVLKFAYPLMEIRRTGFSAP